MSSVLEIRDEDLIRRALMNIKPTRSRPMWSKVSSRFGLGSTYSMQLCERFGIDPEARSRDSMMNTPAEDKS